MTRELYYGDNLEVMRRPNHIKDESIDLCYIDPPFNSKRNYNQIYNNIGAEDRAQAQAFVDTWTWDDEAERGYSEILANDAGRFPVQTVDLIKGLKPVLKKGDLLAYLVSMTLRVVEIHRVLKPSGSFYLHCDPTASHYLKIVLDTIFLTQGGDFRRELIWRSGWVSGFKAAAKNWVRNHDVILYYVKTANNFTFNTIFTPHAEGYKRRGGGENTKGVAQDDVFTDIYSPQIMSFSREKLGYPTQKPEALLERIIRASTNEGDTVLDIYCGCGTTVAAAEKLKRNWVGIDITYHSISLMLRRLEAQFGPEVVKGIVLNGIPRDMASARALALKKDDRVRKEFEKWAVLTYSTNRAIINEKKGADGGIDGTGIFLTGPDQNAKIVFQAKSGGVQRGDIAKLNSDRQREGAELGILITLEPPTGPMKNEAKIIGTYHHELMGRDYDRIQIVTVQEIIEDHKRLEIPMSLEVLSKAQTARIDAQLELLSDEDTGGADVVAPASDTEEES